MLVNTSTRPTWPTTVYGDLWRNCNNALHICIVKIRVLNNATLSEVYLYTEWTNSCNNDRPSDQKFMHHQNWVYLFIFCLNYFIFFGIKVWNWIIKRLYIRIIGPFPCCHTSVSSKTVIPIYSKVGLKDKKILGT